MSPSKTNPDTGLSLRVSAPGRVENLIVVEEDGYRFWLADSRNGSPLFDETGFFGRLMVGCTGSGFLCCPVNATGILRELRSPLTGEMPGTGFPAEPMTGWGSLTGPFCAGISPWEGNAGLLALFPRSLVSLVGSDEREDAFRYPPVTGMVFGRLGTDDSCAAALAVSDAPATNSGKDPSDLPYYFGAPPFPGGIVAHAAATAGLSHGGTVSRKHGRTGIRLELDANIEAAASASGVTDPGFLVRGMGKASVARLARLRAEAGYLSESFLTMEGRSPDVTRRMAWQAAFTPFTGFSVVQSMDRRIFRLFPVPGISRETEEAWKGRATATWRDPGSGRKTVFGLDYAYNCSWTRLGACVSTLRSGLSAQRSTGAWKAVCELSRGWGEEADWLLSFKGSHVYPQTGFALEGSSAVRLDGKPGLTAGLKLEWTWDGMSGYLRLGTRKAVPFTVFDPALAGDPVRKFFEYASLRMGLSVTASGRQRREVMFPVEDEDEEPGDEEYSGCSGADENTEFEAWDEPATGD